MNPLAIALFMIVLVSGILGLYFNLQATNHAKNVYDSTLEDCKQAYKNFVSRFGIESMRQDLRELNHKQGCDT